VFILDISKYTDMALLYASQYGLKVIAALIIFLVGKLAVKKITVLSKKTYAKSKG
jgi:small conductance mechanosensitive channel